MGEALKIQVATVIALLTLSSCTPEPRTRVQPPGRVLLIGIDGASHRLTRPWTQWGLLPALARMTAEGSSGSLRSRRPLVSPRVWTSVATGMLPFVHGIGGWVRREPDGTPRLLTGADRTAPALWNIASAAGLSIGTVNWLNTHPPEKINGVMILDFAIPGERKARFQLGMGIARKAFGRDLEGGDPGGSTAVVTYPVDWIKMVRAVAEEGQPLLDTPNPFVDNKFLPNEFNHPMLARTFQTDDLILRLALDLNQRARPDIMMVLLQGIDRVSHFFWAAIEPDEAYPSDLRFSKEEKQAALNVMWIYYRYTDQLIGRLIDEYGPEDLVLVISDHGFEVVTTLGNGMTGGHESDKALYGVIFARGPGIEPGTELKGVGVHDITPTILAWLGLPVAADMSGHTAPFIEKFTMTPSYKQLVIERVGEIPRSVEDAIIEDLRALGYVE